MRNKITSKHLISDCSGWYSSCSVWRASTRTFSTRKKVSVSSFNDNGPTRGLVIQRFEDHLSLSALPDVVYYDDPWYKILRRALHSSRTSQEYSAGFLPIFLANFQRYSFYVSNASLQSYLRTVRNKLNKISSVSLSIALHFSVSHFSSVLF